MRCAHCGAQVGPLRGTGSAPDVGGDTELMKSLNVAHDKARG